MAAIVREKTEFIVEPGKQEIVIRRVFNAPRERVFKTITDRALIPLWWGPSRFTTIVDRMDVRPGGLWRYINRDKSGNEYGFHGVYHDIVPFERVVNTNEFEGMPGHVGLESATLREVDGKTEMTAKVVYQSVEDRDGMVASGMEEGVRETYDRLADLVEKGGEEFDEEQSVNEPAPRPLYPEDYE